jgi:tetratricopeptide (TPR) repeat protein
MPSRAKALPSIRAIYGLAGNSQVMGRILPGALLLLLLLVPAIGAAGYTANGGGPGSSPGSLAGSPGTFNSSLPSLPNISFTGQAHAARDWYETGFQLTSEERYSEALVAYGKALALNRSLLNAWYYSGDALYRLGRYGDALLAFENATAVDPDFVDAYFYESLVYGKLGRYQDQKEALGRGLEAADRRKADEGAGTPPPTTAQGYLPVPVSPGTAALAIALSLAVAGYVYRKRK